MFYNQIRILCPYSDRDQMSVLDWTQLKHLSRLLMNAAVLFIQLKTIFGGDMHGNKVNETT